MFKQLKNIDTAFKHIRLFSLLFLFAMVVICLFTINRATTSMRMAQQKIYVLLNGKLLDAFAINRSDSLAVEVRDHVKTFHEDFYSLQPDEDVNKKHLTAALYLADNSAQQEYEDLLEKGYYSEFVTGNITQEVPDYDSIVVDINHAPFHFFYYGKLRMIRETSIATRSLVTEGYVRVLQAVSDHNPHGFLIEHWRIIENKDLTVEKR
jgi:conjugative transposon TraK protein